MYGLTNLGMCVRYRCLNVWVNTLDKEVCLKCLNVWVNTLDKEVCLKCLNVPVDKLDFGVSFNGVRVNHLFRY